MITTKDRKLIVFTGVALDLAAGFLLATLVATLLARIVGGLAAVFIFAGAFAVFMVLFIALWHKTLGTLIVAGLTVLVYRKRSQQHIQRRLKKYVTIGAEDGRK